MEMEMELDVGNRTVYLACVCKLVSVVWSGINSCFVLPWLAINPNAKLLPHPSLPVSSQQTYAAVPSPAIGPVRHTQSCLITDEASVEVYLPSKLVTSVRNIDKCHP
uniref:WGS project CBMI000000000 data, contig CS3069_c003874 n=1 Tax=Fusarium clavum TaxID=2594811 RepID=A0A090MIB2_9HYPO|nr:unnamed protein product [Fusarium clavum]